MHPLNFFCNRNFAPTKLERPVPNPHSQTTLESASYVRVTALWWYNTLSDLWLWLPIEARIQYKLCLISCGSSCTCWQGPGIHHQPVTAICHSSVSSDNSSVSHEQWSLPYTRARLKFGERAFGVAAPKAWNKLPLDVRTTTDTDTFKTIHSIRFYFAL